MLKLSSIIAHGKLSFLFLIVIAGLVTSMVLMKKEKIPTQSNVLGSTNEIPTPTLQVTTVPSPTITVPVKARVINIGLVVEDYSNKTGQISSREQELGKISTISIFKQFGLPTNKDLDLDTTSYIKSKNIRLMIAWEPWNPQEGMHQSTDYLKEIIDGKQDEYIRSFASKIKEYGGLVTLRFGHEMNGDWYPWGKRAEDYKNAYRKIYEIFKNENVTNVTWMWSINATPTSGIGSYYPGSSYVNVIGIDGFNFGTSMPGHTWVTFEQIFGPANNAVRAYGKPIMISETASTEIGGRKEEWIKGMFESLNGSFQNITEVIWFDLNKETDWRIDSSGKSLKAMQQNL